MADGGAAASATAPVCAHADAAAGDAGRRSATADPAAVAPAAPLASHRCDQCGARVLGVLAEDHRLSHSACIMPPFLYIGAARNADNKSELLRNHITDILNVSEEASNPFVRCRSGCQCTRSGIGCNGSTSPMLPPLFTYHQVPLRDGDGPSFLDALEQCTRILDDVRASSTRRILVHCVAGMSRSGSIALGYMMRTSCWSLRHAFEDISSRWPLIRPNAAYIEQLQHYEAHLAQTLAPHGDYNHLQLPSLSVADVLAAVAEHVRRT